MKIKDIISEENSNTINIKNKYKKSFQKILEMEENEFYLNYLEIKNTPKLNSISNIFSICILILTFLNITEFFNAEWKKGTIIILLIFLILMILGTQIDVERKNYYNKKNKIIYEYTEFLIKKEQEKNIK